MNNEIATKHKAEDYKYYKKALTQDIEGIEDDIDHYTKFKASRL